MLLMLYLIAITAEAMTGALSAGRRGMDWFGVVLIACVTALGGRYITLVGSPEQVADELESWIAETGLDGFNLTRIVTPESYEDFIDLVIPELQRRGSYKTAYEDGSLRKKLFPEGTDRLPERHAGAAHRRI